jgi:hypothetical protein
MRKGDLVRVTWLDPSFSFDDPELAPIPHSTVGWIVNVTPDFVAVAQEIRTLPEGGIDDGARSITAIPRCIIIEWGVLVASEPRRSPLTP